MVLFRLAKTKDSYGLARLHIITAMYQEGAFMHKLGIVFLFYYYRCVLSVSSTVILIAYNENNTFLGFHYGTTDMAEQRRLLQSRKLVFAFILLPQFLLKPLLFFKVYHRYRSMSSFESKFKFGVKDGARGQYWCWLPNNKYSIFSATLFFKWLIIIQILGYDRVFVETDQIRLFNFHIKSGAEFVNDILLDDGRKRYILFYNLATFNKLK